MEMLIGAGIAVAAAVLLFFLIKKPGDHQDGAMGTNRIGDGLKRLDAGKKTYAVLTPTLLADTQDDKLLEAVLSNLWAKMKPDLSDALEIIREQSQGRKWIFAIYAVTGGVKQDGFEGLKKSEDAELLPACVEGLEAIGATGTAAILAEAISAETGADRFDAPYLESFDTEEGKEKMAAYIRGNPGGFVDKS